MQDDPAGHIPVLLAEVLEMLQPQRPSVKVMVDCTAGLGGHSEALLAAAPQAQLLAVDMDESNLRRTKDRLAPFGGRARFFQANFAQVPEVLQAAGVVQVDAVLADLGIASTQLDDASRGLSFQVEGPLDMRMDRGSEITAATLVNSLGEAELANLIYRFGEERFSRRIARAIVAARKAHTIDSTLELAGIVMSAIPGGARQARIGVHPATRTFQALRIAVNREMENLQSLLDTLPKILTVGGRAAVISFHSLEDRPVKQSFAAWASGGKARLLQKKPIVPGEQEMQNNPRSRSAKLRGIEKTWE